MKCKLDIIISLKYQYTLQKKSPDDSFGNSHKRQDMSWSDGELRVGYLQSGLGRKLTLFLDLYSFWTSVALFLDFCFTR